jgi:hypothetical protein
MHLAAPPSLVAGTSARAKGACCSAGVGVSAARSGAAFNANAAHAMQRGACRSTRRVIACEAAPSNDALALSPPPPENHPPPHTHTLYLCPVRQWCVRLQRKATGSRSALLGADMSSLKRRQLVRPT